ncbi:MAG: hypothetical protein U0Z53_10265 [Blastocatellia bacterium]
MTTIKVDEQLLPRSPSIECSASLREASDPVLIQSRKAQLLEEINNLKRSIARLNRVLAEKQKAYRHLVLFPAELPVADSAGQREGESDAEE